MRFAYADPPYLGQAKKLYGEHPDYAGEVDHAELIDHLQSAFDGWALSCSMKSLPVLMKLCPDDVLTLAWFNTNAPPMGDKRIYAWEPVILRVGPGRRPTTYTKTSLICAPPMWTFRPVDERHVIGEKPEKFARWLFDNAGLGPADEFVDLFPGSGAVGRAWDAFAAQGVLL